MHEFTGGEIEGQSSATFERLIKNLGKSNSDFEARVFSFKFYLYLSPFCVIVDTRFTIASLM